MNQIIRRGKNAIDVPVECGSTLQLSDSQISDYVTGIRHDFFQERRLSLNGHVGGNLLNDTVFDPTENCIYQGIPKILAVFGS